jgi:hypothetical protein
MTWKHPNSETIKKFKIEPSAKKTMVTVFLDCEGLLLCKFLPPKTTINSDKYCETSKNCVKPLNKRDQDDQPLE